MKLFVKYFSFIFISFMAVLLIGLYFIISYVSEDALQERKNQLISYNEMINNLSRIKVSLIFRTII